MRKRMVASGREIATVFQELFFCSRLGIFFSGVSDI